MRAYNFEHGIEFAGIGNRHDHRFQAHVFPESYLAEMKRLDGAVILEEPDPHSGMRYFLRQEAQMPDQHREPCKGRTSSAGSSTWISSGSIFTS